LEASNELLMLSVGFRLAEVNNDQKPNSQTDNNSTMEQAAALFNNEKQHEKLKFIIITIKISSATITNYFPDQI
jgi:hypothetical protein